MQEYAGIARGDLGGRGERWPAKKFPEQQLFACVFDWQCMCHSCTQLCVSAMTADARHVVELRREAGCCPGRAGHVMGVVIGVSSHALADLKVLCMERWGLLWHLLPPESLSSSCAAQPYTQRCHHSCKSALALPAVERGSRHCLKLAPPSTRPLALRHCHLRDHQRYACLVRRPYSLLFA